jgi:hypothetical protein
VGARSHKGQALVVVLALTAAMVAGLLLVFNSGQAANEKTRLVNAADTAAYSAALWEARSLNFQSYMNRAIVANEVAIAQLVTLRSWSYYMEQNLRNAAVITSWIPAVGQAIKTLERVWSNVDRIVQRSLPGVEAAISVWNVDALAFAEVLAHQQAPITAGEIAADVVRANRPGAELSGAARVLAVRNAVGWQTDLTDIYRRGGNELARFRNVVLQSRDGFSAERNWNPPGDLAAVSVRKRGGTDLIGEYSWRAMDTLAVHIDLGFTNQEIPLAWNPAENRRQAQAARGFHGGSFRVNPRSSRLAQRLLVPKTGYQGLPEIRDIHQPARQRDTRLTYVVEAREAGERIATADRALGEAAAVLVDGERVDARPNWQQDSLFALGAAELFFRRPVERTDRRREYPSLFNPYWQVRLAPVPRLERGLAAMTKGLAVDPYAVLP